MNKQYYNNQYASDIEAKAKSNYIAGMTWEDVAQELDLALWIGLPKYQSRNGAGERTFAHTVMRNRIIDLKKATKRQKRQIDTRHLTFSELAPWRFGKDWKALTKGLV
jgi:DNA-directed RNA polymerase specialized sigma24 family protein